MGWIDAQEGAADASVFVHARSAVWTSAVPEGDGAQEEVLFERGPLLGCGLPVLTDVDSQGAWSLDELLMGAGSHGRERRQRNPA